MDLIAKYVQIVQNMIHLLYVKIMIITKNEFMIRMSAHLQHKYAKITLIVDLITVVVNA